MTKDEELLLARKIFWLLKKDAIFLHEYNEEKNIHDEGTYIAINCNDVFVPGSDSENLDEKDIDKYIQVIKEADWRYGPMAWVYVKRGYKISGSEKDWFSKNTINSLEFQKAVILVEKILNES